MNNQTLKAIAYVQNALSFIFLDADIKDKINSIYLYGSAVRGELTKDSDIDVFIDTAKMNERSILPTANAALARFYKSNDYGKWKLLKFLHPISIQAGELMKWQLKISIIAEGILLYSKTSEILPEKREALFIIEQPKKKKHYLHLIRALYGRKEKNYKPHGFLHDVHGKKLGANIFIVPKEYQKQAMELLQKESIVYSMKEISVNE